LGERANFEVFSKIGKFFLAIGEKLVRVLSIGEKTAFPANCNHYRKRIK
jgi:hypothetical protein